MRLRKTRQRIQEKANLFHSQPVVVLRHIVYHPPDQSYFHLSNSPAGSRRQAASAQRREFLPRAQAYAQAALRDFQHYQGRAADMEAKVQRLLDGIAQALAELPA
jgi:hypothetical protein